MKLDEERTKLEKEIFRLVQSFEERTEFIVSEVQFVRKAINQSIPEHETSILLGVRVEVEG